ncbi:hypothetical protein EDD69_1341 [Thermolongibacillus altinsuensis]|uniref:Uncharacterized protein n=1 Tax=Thermolongibacillus altinsuensis TaxID=575256 RepID=A0A4R1Q4Q6_9BACL|nr:hypothetical protein [Thermolongibacillus altinsuensis]TCL42687.1 hypothetical protein EDD69_1341 [Thermolongibacillus altinsuensis]
MSKINRAKKGFASLFATILALVTVETASAVTLDLTQEQKEEYYKQYVQIVDKAMEKKPGISIELSPMEDFPLEAWIEPKEFEARIQDMVEQHLETERKKLNALSSTTKEAVTNLNGETSKTTYIYVPDTIWQIEVTGKFETQYNPYNGRQLFANADNISSKVISSFATWEQTSYEASLIDGGRTYSIRIEGVLSLSGVSFEKAFTIEFHCNEVGKIS